VTVPESTFETRTVAAEFEMRDDAQTGAPIFEGYASVFDTPYNMGPFWEQVDKRAFNRTLGQNPDVRLLVDHAGQPLARTKSGTLQLHADTRGLHAKATLDPTDPDVQRLLPKMRRGDLDQMSFSFRVAGSQGDEWEYGSDRTLRTLRELSLADQDVSIVTYPASTTTSASLRSTNLHEARCVFVEQMAREMRNGNSLSPQNLAKLREVLDELGAVEAPAVEAPTEDVMEQPPAQRGLPVDTARRMLAALDLSA
jgi:HK97 family phage prohead protease